MSNRLTTVQIEALRYFANLQEINEAFRAGKPTPPRVGSKYPDPRVVRNLTVAGLIKARWERVQEGRPEVAIPYLTDAGRAALGAK